MLPFAAMLQERFGSLFANWNCALCNLEEDCLSHLITCSALTEHWQTLLSDIITLVEKFSKKHNLSINSRAFIDAILPRTNEHFSFIQDNYSNWLKGFIDSSTLSQIVRFTKSRPLATTLTLKIVIKLQTLFRSSIWSRRCTSQKDKESSKGINLHSLIKAKKSKVFTGNHQVQMISHQHSTSTNTVGPIVLDDIPALNQDQLNQHSKIDRFGWGKDLLGIGLTNWMTKGIKEWWMMNRHGSIMKKGGLVKNTKFMRAGYDQGSHRS
jgi:hypothetical protein